MLITIYKFQSIFQVFLLVRSYLFNRRYSHGWIYWYFAAGRICLPTMCCTKEEVCSVRCEHRKSHRRRLTTNWSYYWTDCWYRWSRGFACLWSSVTFLFYQLLLLPILLSKLVSQSMSLCLYKLKIVNVTGEACFMHDGINIYIYVVQNEEI